ncbi:hypothetical protein ZWY2020_009679 [Hordeum vulgare]|nr:hypothetical protein ZWY2020_009679 [Hordeum vulgare]
MDSDGFSRSPHPPRGKRIPNSRSEPHRRAEALCGGDGARRRIRLLPVGLIPSACIHRCLYHPRRSTVGIRRGIDLLHCLQPAYYSADAFPGSAHEWAGRRMWRQCRPPCSRS